MAVAIADAYRKVVVTTGTGSGGVPGTTVSREVGGELNLDAGFGISLVTDVVNNKVTIVNTGNGTGALTTITDNNNAGTYYPIFTRSPPGTQTFTTPADYVTITLPLGVAELRVTGTINDPSGVSNTLRAALVGLIEQETMQGVRVSNSASINFTATGPATYSTVNGYWTIPIDTPNAVADTLSSFTIATGAGELNPLTGTYQMDTMYLDQTTTPMTYNPSTGTLTAVNFIGNLTASNAFIGASATAGRFPNAISAVSTTAAGIQQNESVPIGLIAEATSTTDQAAGLYGVGYTNGTIAARGVVGEAHPAASADTGSAIGVQAYSHSTHAGGINTGLYASAQNGAFNYALFMAAGNIRSSPAQTWQIKDNDAAALNIFSTGKDKILNVITTDGAEGISTSGTLSVTGNITQGYITIRSAVNNSLGIGLDAGATTPGTDAISIGNTAGQTSQGNYSVAIGSGAGTTSQGAGSVAIGLIAGTNSQGAGSIAIGNNAATDNQGAGAVAIGYLAGSVGQGTNAIAIGNSAGILNQAAGSVIIQTGSAGGLTIDSIKSATATSNFLYYDTSTKEITYAGITASAVGLGNVENTALSTWTGSSSITTVGTLTNLTVTNTISGSINGNAATATTATTATSATSAGKSTNLVGGNSTTLLGSVPYQSNTDTTSLLSPNTTTTKKFLRMTGDGTNGAVPAWDTPSTLTISTGLSGTSYNGTGDVTIAIDNTVATLSGTQTLTNKRINSRVLYGTNSLTTHTFPVDDCDVYIVQAMSANVTFPATVGSPVDGQRLTVRLRDNGTPRTLTWTSGVANGFREIGVTLPLTTVANKLIYIGLVYNSLDARWDAIAVGTQA